MFYGLNIAFFGSSLVSAYRNGAATYYRGIVRALAGRGHRITFYEPDLCGRQQRRDLPDPDWARVVVYPGEGQDGVIRALARASSADLVIKASGVGAGDEWLERAVIELRQPGMMVAFWDVDAPATLARLERNPDDPFRELIPRYDAIFTRGGGDPVVKAYRRLGARECSPIYNALDPVTHYPVAPDPRFEADLAFLGNRQPEGEARVEEFFLRPATALPQHRFLLGGDGWDDKSLTANINCAGQVDATDHNAFNSTPRAALSVNCEGLARYGFSPAPRVFEAAGAAACLITDAWRGIEAFFEPGREVLVARDGGEVIEQARRLTTERARRIGAAARRRALAEHTYARRAEQVESLLKGKCAAACGFV